MNLSKMLISKIAKTNHDRPFEHIIGYAHIKRLFKMALDADSPIHILLVGPQASAKTMFLTSLMQLKNSYFTDGGNSTKSGMIDYLFENRPTNQKITKRSTFDRQYFETMVFDLFL